MSVPRSVADVLAEHVTLEVEGLGLSPFSRIQSRLPRGSLTVTALTEPVHFEQIPPEQSQCAHSCPLRVYWAGCS